MSHCRYQYIAKCLFFTLAIILQLDGYAQEVDSLYQKVKVKAYIPIVIKDSVYTWDHDTVLYLQPGLIDIDSTSHLQSQEFYKKVHKFLGKRKLTKELSNLLFVQQKGNKITKNAQQELISTGMCFEGKTVRSITYIRLQPFGADVKKPDPIITTRFTRYANGVHSRTKERVIDKNIVFNIGDVIDDTDFSDSERLLRALDFIKDALIYACEVDQTFIDVYIITQDQWTIGVSGRYGSFTDFELGVFNSNFVGTGQYVYLGAVVKSEDNSQPLGYNFEYRFQNVQGTFIDADLKMSNNYLETIFEVEFDKDFVTTNTKTAGGYRLTNSRQLYGYSTSDSAYLNVEDNKSFFEPLELTYMGGWLGRATHLNGKQNQNITVSGGFDRIQFFQRPIETAHDTLYYYHNKAQYAFSLTLNQRNYRQLKYLQGFGRTEDVPYGWLTSVTTGWEQNEFLGQRPYIGMAIDVGQFSPYGYFKVLAEGATFVSDEYKQGTFHLNFQYFTNLIAVRENFFRLLLDIDYLDGYDRIPGDYLYFQNNDTFSDYQINRYSKKGTKRFQMKQENIWFTKWFFFGFKFAIYQNVEVGILSDRDKVSISKRDIYTSVGAGIRTRNENLVFNTLTLDLRYFPNANLNNSPFEVLIGTRIDLPLQDFKPTKPTFLRFQ